MKLAITIDDPHVETQPLLEAAERDARIRAALRNHGNLQACLFVCGKKISSSGGAELLRAWDSEGHLLANHTYSHQDLNSEDTDALEYQHDIGRGHEAIQHFQHFISLFRYPYLKGGNTLATRDEVRGYLKRSGYKHGYVTIDASDWCIDGRLVTAIRRGDTVDLSPYRDFYLAHIEERAVYYDSLATRLTGRSVLHTLVIHHNLLNALFLADLLRHFDKLGWELLDAAHAFQDPIYSAEPDIVPFGESIVWAMAKESGDYESELRYPGEDESYERVKLNAAHL